MSGKPASACFFHPPETVQLLEDIKSEDTSLEILGHFLFNPFAVVIGDDVAIVTPSFISRGGRTVPTFKYQDTGDAWTSWTY